MNANNIVYSRTNENELPELILQAYNSNNQLMTLTGLGSEVTVKGVTGYNITNRGGIIPIIESQSITTNNNQTVSDNYRVVITLINHDFNQKDT